MEVIFNIQKVIQNETGRTFNFIDKDGTPHVLSFYILNRVLSLIANKYLYNQKEHSEFTEIHSDKFSQIDPNYRTYLNWLERNDIIIIRNSYVIGDKQKGIKGKSKEYGFNDIFKIWGMVIKIRKDKSDENTNADQSFLIPIDKTVLKSINRDYKAIKLNDQPIIKQPKIETDELYVIDFKSYLSSEFNFWRFKNKDTFYNWKSGRLYTTFTSCSKSTRLNNFYFEEQLANKDIPSSFPLWLSIWLLHHGVDTTDYEFLEFCNLARAKMDGEGNFIENKDGEIKTQFYNDLCQKMNNNRNVDLAQATTKPTTICKHVIIVDKEWDRDGFVIGTEKIKCKHKLEDDGLCPEHGYIEVNNPTLSMRQEQPHISKNQAKEAFQEWLNGNNERTTLVNYIFKMYYGGIQAIVDQHKNGDKKYMYNQLVAMETNFIFNVICARLYSEIPEIKILTCHDQIYFEQMFYDQVDQIWNEELKKVYALLPNHEESDLNYDELGILEDRY